MLLFDIFQCFTDICLIKADIGANNLNIFVVLLIVTIDSFKSKLSSEKNRNE